LGKGSNILVADKGYKGLLINFQFSIFNFQSISNSKIFKIVAGTGLSLGKLVNTSVDRRLTGLEWAVGIPGTVGGAIWGNAGAFGKSIANIIKEVKVFDAKELRIKNYELRDCKFGYRDSIFRHKKNLIILSVTLKLKKGEKKEIKEKMIEFLNYRKRTQPLNYPSAGSIFKNPKLFKKFSELEKFNKNGQIPAAWLIGKCGLKGKRIGNAQISKKHANFIVNLGNAKAADVKRLINLAKKKVKNKFKIELKEEIQYL